MRRPSTRGLEITPKRVAAWRLRFEGYRTLVTDERIRRWLKRFRESQRDTAARVLDCVRFIREVDIEKAFPATIITKLGWNKNTASGSGKWRFVAFSQSAGESGDTMLHKCRSALGLGAKRYDDLFINKRDLLAEGLGPDDTVVFVDDFAGTGNQVCEGWRTIMCELLPDEPQIHLVLVACSREAKERITRELGINVLAAAYLNDSDNVFSAKCLRFSRSEKAILLEYCTKASKNLPRGYGDCGFLVVLAHKTPNNSIPILHVKNRFWKGLFPRS